MKGLDFFYYEQPKKIQPIGVDFFKCSEIILGDDDDEEEESRVVEIPFKDFLKGIRLVSRFLPPSDILTLLTLNKEMYERLLDPSLYPWISATKLKYTTANQLIASNMRKHFKSFTGIKAIDSKAVFKCMKNTINLIKNPSFDNQLDFWYIQPDRSIFKFENDSQFKDRNVALSTTNGWFIISQDISLPEGVDRVVVAGMATNRKVECGSIVRVKLEAGIKEEKVELVLPDNYPDYDVYEWVIAKVSILVGAGSQDLKVSFEANDENYEAGNCGGRIGYCFVYAFDLN